MTQLALRAYRLDHGRLPDKLESLVPAYLDKLPLDPFDETRGFRYRPKGAAYVLYSIGPDVHDDIGKPIERPATYEGYKYSVWRDGTGDIVAGVNR